MTHRSPIRILLAEDDPNHQCLLSMAITEGRPHVSVRVVASGRELTAILQGASSRDFDCLVLDFNLPDTDAAEVLALWSKHGMTCPAIVVSSSTDQRIVIESVRNGGVDFVPKIEAVDGDRLWNRIEIALARHRRRQETRRQIVRRHRKLAKLASEDPLTGLANRRFLEQVFRDGRRKAERRGRVSVLMIDVDHFKHINDRHGHAAGDRVLRRIADTLRNCLREGDTACRWGGEEFVVIRPDTTAGDAVLWAERFRAAVEAASFEFGAIRLPVTVSIGVANCPSSRLRRDTVDQADQAMYLAKRDRNRVCTCEMLAFEKALDETPLDHDVSPDERLRHAMEKCRPALGLTQYEHLTSHAEHVSNMSLRLGRALGMDAGAMERLRVAGLCHDLGKIAVPEDVLGKPGALSAEERNWVSRHAEEGAALCARLGADAETADYVRHHHTRFDSNGVTPGTGPNPVPLGARILAVADAFAALTSERSYKPHRPFMQALRELQRAKGTQFDPDVIDAIPAALLSAVPHEPD